MVSLSKSTNKKNDDFQLAINETNHKVLSSLLPSIINYINEEEEYNATKDGLDFLEVKNTLLLSYLIDLTYLLKLSTSGEKEGGEERKQACLKRLEEMKIAIDKIRPMEKRLRYQLDKLLALGSGVFAAAAADIPTAPTNVDDEGKEDDPLSFRPNPSALLGRDGGGHDDDETESSSDDDDENDDDSSSNQSDVSDDDEDLKAAKAAVAKSRSSKKTKKKHNEDSSDEDDDDKSSNKNKGIYQPPRLSATPFATDDDVAKLTKEERQLQKQRERARRSELVATLRNQYGDAPEEEDVHGGSNLGKQRDDAKRLAARDEERTKHEEENMVRLQVTKKEKQERKRIMRNEASNLGVLSNFGDLVHGVEAAFGKGKGGDRDDQMHDDDGDGGRFSNGKRKRLRDEFGNSEGMKNRGRKKKGAMGTNSFQRALYDTGGSGNAGGGKKKSNSRR